MKAYVEVRGTLNRQMGKNRSRWLDICNGDDECTHRE